ncbi:MAG: hypothetical protein U1F43_05580 [Myxococcota bacterium]
MTTGSSAGAAASAASASSAWPQVSARRARDAARSASQAGGPGFSKGTTTNQLPFSAPQPSPMLNCDCRSTTSWKRAAPERDAVAADRRRSPRRADDVAAGHDARGLGRGDEGQQGGLEARLEAVAVRAHRAHLFDRRVEAELGQEREPRVGRGAPVDLLAGAGVEQRDPGVARVLGHGVAALGRDRDQLPHRIVGRQGARAAEPGPAPRGQARVVEERRQLGQRVQRQAQDDLRRERRGRPERGGLLAATGLDEGLHGRHAIADAARDQRRRVQQRGDGRVAIALGQERRAPAGLGHGHQLVARQVLVDGALAVHAEAEVDRVAGRGRARAHVEHQIAVEQIGLERHLDVAARDHHPRPVEAVLRRDDGPHHEAVAEVDGGRARLGREAEGAGEEDGGPGPGGRTHGDLRVCGGAGVVAAPGSFARTRRAGERIQRSHRGR